MAAASFYNPQSAGNYPLKSVKDMLDSQGPSNEAWQHAQYVQNTHSSTAYLHPQGYRQEIQPRTSSPSTYDFRTPQDRSYRASTAVTHSKSSPVIAVHQRSLSRGHYFASSSSGESSSGEDKKHGKGRRVATHIAGAVGGRMVAKKLNGGKLGPIQGLVAGAIGAKILSSQVEKHVSRKKKSHHASHSSTHQRSRASSPNTQSAFKPAANYHDDKYSRRGRSRSVYSSGSSASSNR
ncbi:hypothetical protein MMC09_004405 [Bachmanniomyces sp. S44760]|nr:hypothetical protein [Bachmanniomyces sp. S44760]